MSNGGFDLLQSALHPMTCGGDRGDQSHRDYQAVHGGDLGELVQSDSGLVCPVCGWRQPEPLHVSQAAEIAQLKAELELTKKQRNAFHQLIEDAHPHVQLLAEESCVDLICSYWYEDVGEELEIVAHSEDPDLYAHLAGRGK